MQVKVHIVKAEGLKKVVRDSEIKDSTIKVRRWDDYGDDYWEERVPITIEKTFLIMIQTQFIRNDEKGDPLNAYYMSGGFGQVNRLAYAYSVNMIDISGSKRWSLYQSDNLWSDSGIKQTKFDMYSYHINEPKQEYLEWRLDWEIFDQLNFNEIFGKWLDKSDIRDNKIDGLFTE